MDMCSWIRLHGHVFVDSGYYYCVLDICFLSTQLVPKSQIIICLASVGHALDNGYIFHMFVNVCLA